VQAAVSGYEREFDYGVKVSFVDATTTDAEKECQELGFSNHGLVIRSAAGDVLFSQPDHEVVVDDVHAKLVELLGEPG
jgi:hypothetical protein